VEVQSPYPGLASFTEKNAAFFFGREAEVTALWTKLRARKLLAVIAPSGAGKTSLVRAGVVASRPEGWAAIVSTPGAAPLRGLGQALVSQLAGDVEALERILSVDDPAVAFDLVSRWRKGHGEALLVVDQFEELFTLNPAEVQERFAGLVRRLAREADVHVLLSLRDDFLIRCSEQEALAGVFLDLTPLPALSQEGLVRALVEPAKKRGYRFEDEALVDEMVESVEGARAALPLLAFAVSRLWEKRDRERKLLTRAAYEEIGGVAGALAQHAEATMDRIGAERQAVVREIFRNLVTAQGTRAVADREELLSAFPQRKEAEEVLRGLIDARLVTSYEVETAEGQSHHRVEVVHESLLRAWPRLVRWQMQDEEGAVLRDQLKQAAHLWEDRGRTSDLLWTGTAFREFELWRERYPGALTALEEAFAKAMAERALQQVRFRKLVAGSILAAALVVAVVTGSLWRRSEAARERARAEALRAEAGKLLALGRTHLEADPTAALAYAKGSLGLYDTPEARRFALEVLWRGPVARVLSLEQAAKQLRLPEEERGIEPTLTMSPDGRWLAAKRANEPRVLLFPSDGGPPRALAIPPDATATSVLAFGPRSDLLITPGPGQSLRYSSLPDLREIRTVGLAGLGSWSSFVRGDKLFVYTETIGKNAGQKDLLVQTLRLPEGEPKVVATLNNVLLGDADPAGTKAVVCAGGHPLLTVGLQPLDGASPLRVLGRLPAQCWALAYSPRGDRVATTETSGETRIWSTAEGATNPARVLRGPEYTFSSNTLFDPRGRRVSQAGPYGTEHVWDLDEIPDARPFVLGRPGPSAYVHALTYDPGSRWMATGGADRATIEFWPVSNPRRRELPGLAASYSLSFTPDGRWLATCAAWMRLWALNAGDGGARDLKVGCDSSLAMHPSGGILAAPGWSWVVHLPFPGARERVLAVGGPSGAPTVAFDWEGQRAVAVIGGVTDPAQRVLRVWDLPSGREQRHSIAHLLDADWSGFNDMAFAPDGSLYVAGKGGVRRLRLPTERGGAVSGETVHAAGSARLDLSREGKLLVVTASHSREQTAAKEELLLLDLAGHSSRRITTHGSQLQRARLSPSGRVIVTGGADGVVRVGPASGEEPHILFGHKGPVFGLAISPDERWIASSSDESISIWPMPDVTKPPLHTLPHTELMARLDALTNLRVVRDPMEPTGWKLEIGPFPGWKDVPTW
jgi:WD40 repeat protein